MPPDGVHKNPCRIPVPELVREVPTIHPRLLMLRAELCPPPREPRSRIPPLCVQEKACPLPLAAGACPTTVAASLTANATVPAEPRFCRPPSPVQMKPSVLWLPFGKSCPPTSFLDFTAAAVPPPLLLPPVVTTSLPP